MIPALFYCSAANAGADRLEVCGNLGIGGGTTPSLGLVRAIQKALPHIPIMVSPSSLAGTLIEPENRLWFGPALGISCILKKSWT